MNTNDRLRGVAYIRTITNDTYDKLVFGRTKHSAYQVMEDWANKGVWVPSRLPNKTCRDKYIPARMIASITLDPEGCK